jgi:hypothetical protein
MTPMSHETCLQRRLSLFRIVWTPLWYDPYVTWDMLAKTTFAISDRLGSKPRPPTPSRLSSVTESANTAGKWTWVVTNWWYPGQSKVWLSDMTYVTYDIVFWLCLLFQENGTWTTLSSWKCEIKYDSNTFLKEYIFNSNFFCLMSFWEKYLYWNQCHIWHRSYQIGLKGQSKSLQFLQMKLSVVWKSGWLSL